MARTDKIKVRSIIKTVLGDGEVCAFIDDAALWVTEELVATGQTAKRLELIERYLAAALIRLRDLGLTSAKLDDVSEQYQVHPEISGYLLQAATWDASGKVRAFFLSASPARSAHATVAKRFRDDL